MFLWPHLLGAALLLVRVGVVVLDPALVPAQGGANLHLPDDPAAILIRGRDQPSWENREREGRMHGISRAGGICPSTELSPLCHRSRHRVRLLPALTEDGDVAIQTSGSAYPAGSQRVKQCFHTSVKHLSDGLSQQGHSSRSSWAEETEENQERKELPLVTPRDIMVSAAPSPSATAPSQEALGEMEKGISKI